MARQIQLRRGTAAQHENFTGADGEVTVDTTNHTLRVHDGQTVGGTALMRADAMDAADYVVAFQAPTAANGYTWYRKYKSGWVEQGGLCVGKKTATFPVPMNDSDYIWSINSIYDNTSTAIYSELGALSNKSATSLTKAGNAQTFVWSVRGMAA